MPQILLLDAVVFPGFELLDLFGPLEFFGMLPGQVQVRLLAQKRGGISSHQGPEVLAQESLDTASQGDILLIPGGLGTRREVDNSAFIDSLRERAQQSTWVATVCTGSALLARTGLLDGRRATSNKLAMEWVRTQGPRVSWIDAARWVEDGTFFTSSGVSAGMDMSLGLVQKIWGRETSLRLAHYAEYVWQEDKDVDPFSREN